MERAFGGHGDHGRWWNNPKLVERLKLTEEQRKAFDAVLQEHREKLIDLRGSLEKAEVAMEPLMSADQPNEGKILAQIDRLAQARAELEKANARFLLAIRAKLTPEQWKQLQADRAEHEERGEHGDRGERGPQHPHHGGQGASKPGQENQAVPPPDGPPPTGSQSRGGDGPDAEGPDGDGPEPGAAS
jgi:Spy/CpxP family protein refolding chaperone